MDHISDDADIQPDLARTLAAQRLWSAVLVGTPLPYRALPASMLTYTAYLLGDAQLAQDSIGYALDTDPDDRPALPSAAVGLLMPPEVVRRAAEHTAAQARAHIQQGPPGA